MAVEMVRMWVGEAKQCAGIYRFLCFFVNLPIAALIIVLVWIFVKKA